MKPIRFGQREFTRKTRKTIDYNIAEAALIDPTFDDTKIDPAELRASLGLDEHRRAPAE